MLCIYKGRQHSLIFCIQSFKDNVSKIGEWTNVRDILTLN